jgi:2,5-dioxopentanoate dehydrogenase
MKIHSPAEIDRAAFAAHEAFLTYRMTDGPQRANLLRAVGISIDKNRELLAKIAVEETHLPYQRLQTELSRTINQCLLFAELVLEGSWVRAIIDTALPNRKPVARPDLRQMQIALGPIAVFGASNFPFAYSVCGGDTVAALAAGCTVLYKVNPGHPQTSDAVADLISQAVAEQRLPSGVFAHIHGEGNQPGLQLVMHPLIKAVGFTGSMKGGRALFDAASKREEPIPVYAEMGSTNPVFILPRIIEERKEELAVVLSESNTASVGQFCTNPGIMVSGAGPAGSQFRNMFGQQIRNTVPQVMLNDSIQKNFQHSIDLVKTRKSVSLLATSSSHEAEKTSAYAFETPSSNFLADRQLWEEMFGPASIQVTVDNMQEVYRIAQELPGQITASVWGTEEDLVEFSNLLTILQLKAGRIIINGVPTGVEVCAAMNHGGPYPATTDSKFTSVGTQSIYRFTRPVCFQNFPQRLLPQELQDENVKSIWRTVNGQLTKSAIDMPQT